MPMHDLPLTVFGAKDHRGAQIVRKKLFPYTKSALEPLYLHNVGKLRGHVLRYDLEAHDLAIPTRRSGTLHSLGNLRPSVRDHPTGVCEGYIVSMGEHLLGGLGVPSHELTYRLVVLLD